MRNGRLLTITRVSGAGVSMTALYEGRAFNDKPYVYFYLHCDDGPTIRVQLWEISVGEFFKSVGYDEIKGRRLLIGGLRFFSISPKRRKRTGSSYQRG
jgi:hypothetical protein